MAIPELTKKKAEKVVSEFCDKRIPAHIRHQLRLSYETRGNSFTIFENRPPWHKDMGEEWTSSKVAQFRYIEGQGMWTLCWADRNGKWLLFEGTKPTSHIEELLNIVDEDSYGCFWG